MRADFYGTGAQGAEGRVVHDIRHHRIGLELPYQLNPLGTIAGRGDLPTRSELQDHLDQVTEIRIIVD